VVIGGQETPDPNKYTWNALAEEHELLPIVVVEDWRELITRKWRDNYLQDEHIEGVLAVTKGEPGQTYAVLEALVKQKQK